MKRARDQIDAPPIIVHDVATTPPAVQTFVTLDAQCNALYRQLSELRELRTKARYECMEVMKAHDMTKFFIGGPLIPQVQQLTVSTHKQYAQMSLDCLKGAIRDWLMEMQSNADEVEEAADGLSRYIWAKRKVTFVETLTCTVQKPKPLAPPSLDALNALQPIAALFDEPIVADVGVFEEPPPL
jgi:hypothetical protein